MNAGRKQVVPVGLALALVVLVAGCAAGDDRFTESAAGFWAGLWHGFVILVTFVISLFDESVRIYETNNAGNIYNLGFLLGAAIFFSGGVKIRAKRRREKKKGREWDAIGAKVEEKVRRGIRVWLAESGKEDTEWKEIAEKVEEKIKRELRKWAEKEEE